MITVYEIACNLDIVECIEADNEEQAKEIAMERIKDRIAYNFIYANDFDYCMIGKKEYKNEVV